MGMSGVTKKEEKLRNVLNNCGLENVLGNSYSKEIKSRRRCL